jgi:uncharacterized membrane protein YGL010W
MTFQERVDRYVESYKRDHQHPVNKALHMIGIPMIVLSLPLLFFAPPLGIFLFVLGWIIQFVGHAFEGKAPSFLRDPTFLVVGPTWYAKRLFAKATNRPDPADVG